MFNTFALAERLGYTIAELLTGEKQTITVYEFHLWAYYHEVKSKLEADAQRKANRSK